MGGGVGVGGWSADEARQGAVSVATYAAYVTAAGGLVAVLTVIVASLVAEAARAFSFWWLAYWLNQGNGSTAANVSTTLSPLSLSITASLFNSRLKTFLFCKSFPTSPPFSSSGLTTRIRPTVYHYS